MAYTLFGHAQKFLLPRWYMLLRLLGNSFEIRMAMWRLVTAMLVLGLVGRSPRVAANENRADVLVASTVRSDAKTCNVAEGKRANAVCYQDAQENPSLIDVPPC